MTVNPEHFLSHFQALSYRSAQEQSNPVKREKIAGKLKPTIQQNTILQGTLSITERSLGFFKLYGFLIVENTRKKLRTS